MKYLSIKIIVLCILLPPILYIGTIEGLRKYFQAKYETEIREIYICKTCPLYDGSIRLKDSINQVIDDFLKHDKGIALGGIKIDVLITSQQGILLYPAITPSYTSKAETDTVTAPFKVASENFRLLNEGLKVSVSIKLPHNTLISNIVLAVYMCVFIILASLYYRVGIRKLHADELKKKKEIDRLKDHEKKFRNKLAALSEDKNLLESEIEETRKALQLEKEKAISTEEDMIDEMISLEEKLKKIQHHQHMQEEEIASLTDKLQRYEKKKESKHKKKSADLVRKRFKTIYKRIEISGRALDGYADLTEDLKIKAEEVIFQLNESPNQVTIKRKVFGKKSRETVFEVLFSYNGRLYFRTLKDGRPEVVTIGTKNTQTKDLEFVNNL